MRETKKQISTGINKMSSDSDKCYVENNTWWDLAGGAMDRNPPANEGDMGSIPGAGRFHMPQSN